MSVSHLFEPSEVGSSGQRYPFRLSDTESLQKIKRGHGMKDSTALSNMQGLFVSVERPGSHRLEASMWDMNTRQIRKQNLERLRDRYKERCKRERKRYKLKDFAALYGIEPRTCSQILNGYVGLGEDLARRIESAARPKLPYGWMDVPHSATEPVNKDELDFQEAFLTVYRAHPESARKLLIKMVKDLLAKGDE